MRQWRAQDPIETMSYQRETFQEKLARLRGALSRAQDELIEAEAQLADRLAEVHAFEARFESSVGHLIDRLAAVEAELSEYLRRIQALRDEQLFGAGYQSVEEQYRRAWHVPPDSAPKPPAQPLPSASEAQFKKLYRQLARRFHPDLANNESERAYRTEKMQAVNDAYAARSMIELAALAKEAGNDASSGSVQRGRTDEEMITALAEELARCQRRQREIEEELRNLHNRQSVELSLEVKLARRQGRDLMAEMVTDLERKIGRKTAERDMIKAQFDSLDLDSRRIRPE
jgi:predicted  nucleic acid-binding Zn-ribbon protein